MKHAFSTFYTLIKHGFLTNQNTYVKGLSYIIMCINNVGGTSISIKPLPDMYLNYQQAYNCLDWVYESFVVQ